MTSTQNLVEDIRKSNLRKKQLINMILFTSVIILCCLTLSLGNTMYSLETIVKVLMGEDIQGATFAIMKLRLPRMIAGLFSGFAFGLAGVTFQKMMQNPLASPDILGITSGSSVAAVFCLLVLRYSGNTASIISIICALLITLHIYFLSQIRGFSISKLVLIGIGTQAMLRALISYMLLKANINDVSSTLRWLSGSLNTISVDDTRLLIFSVVICGAVLCLFESQLNVLELGEQMATTLGLRPKISRFILILAAVFMLACATAVTGPIAFVSFLAGPIANKIGGKDIFSAALLGAILVMGCELIGQFALPYKMPVGVVTGIVGAPYLVFLLINERKEGA